LACNVYIDENNIHDIKTTLNNFNYFKQVECLSLHIVFNIAFRYEHLRYGLLDLSGLSNMKDLIYISLTMSKFYGSGFCIPEETLNGITRTFPKLCSLQILSPLCAKQGLIRELDKAQKMKYLTLTLCRHTETKIKSRIITICRKKSMLDCV
jgi:hypothetical protein